MRVKFNKTNIIRIIVVLILISALMIMRKIEADFLLHSNRVKTLDMRFGYSINDVFSLFMKLGSVGRGVYVKYLCNDFIFTISFAIVQNYILKFIMGRSVINSKWHGLLCIAYLRAFFDVAENIIILILLTSFPSIPEGLVITASSATRLKFIIYGLWVIAIPVSLIIRIAMGNKLKIRGDM